MCAERITQTLDIVKHSMGIEEKGVKLRLTIVDTPGFGDAVNNNERYSECLASEDAILSFIFTMTVVSFV